MTPGSPLQRGSSRPFLPPARKAGARCSPARPGPFSSLTVAKRPCRCTLAGLRVPSLYSQSVEHPCRGAPDWFERIVFSVTRAPAFGDPRRSECPAKPHVSLVLVDGPDRRFPRRRVLDHQRMSRDTRNVGQVIREIRFYECNR